MTTPVYLFTDGGVARRNPSPLGGSWAWRLVRQTIEPELDGINHPGEVLLERSGLLLPSMLKCPEISSNQCEVFAMIRGLSVIAHGIALGNLEHFGTIEVCSDSEVGLAWFRGEYRPWSMPEPLVVELETAHRAARSVGLKLTHRSLGGHPNKLELAAGYRPKKRLRIPGEDPNLAVSLHNVAVDKECQRLAQALAKRSQGGQMNRANRANEGNHGRQEVAR